MTTAADLWALGDYDRIAAVIAELGQVIVDAAGVRPGDRVLDVGAGTGNAAIAAAAAGAPVVATDVTEPLLVVGAGHARTRGLDIDWQVADAQQLPFADGEFDVVMSCVAAMFAPDHAATARELVRVCRPGGKVAMVNWTASGAAGRYLALLSSYNPPPAGAAKPVRWGDPAYVAELFGGTVSDLSCTLQTIRMAFDGSPENFCALYRSSFPPVIAAYAAVASDPDRTAALDRDLLAFAIEDETTPYEYLLMVATAAS